MPENSQLCADTLQIVYVLTNAAMPGLIKIGMTRGSEAASRTSQLYSTGVPLPFECAYECAVPNAADVERALHTAFGPFRINPNREFFRMQPHQAIVILRLLHARPTAVVTAELEQNTPPEDKAAAQKEEVEAQLRRARRPRMDYLALGIPIGAVLTYRDGTTSCRIADARNIEVDGVICSLTSLTRRVMGLADDYALQPSPFWLYNGRTLKELYDEFYGGDEVDEGLSPTATRSAAALKAHATRIKQQVLEAGSDAEQEALLRKADEYRQRAEVLTSTDA
ncbi:MAG: GIY-YIG nuclease family protein [Alcaligenaceae bacterium]|nr:MAG: GIY-YIG nuclease family protein [Alcaligenaceae bacterium]